MALAEAYLAGFATDHHTETGNFLENSCQYSVRKRESFLHDGIRKSFTRWLFY
jgi:hypothetical protein